MVMLLKTRIISAAVGLIVLAVALIFYDTLLSDILVCLICADGILELFKAAGLTKYKVLCAVSIFCSMAIVLRNTRAVHFMFSVLCYIFVVLLFIFQLRHHRDVKIGEVCYAFLMTIFLSLSFGCFILAKTIDGAQLGVFYLLITFGSAWWADTGAYFAGTFWGKHKLCPQVSPKKTVEGLIGGGFTAVIGNALVSLLFQWLSNTLAPFGYLTHPVTVNLPLIIAVTPFLALVGVLGDLSASVIKRQYNVKDFGNIMPGHGGVMDRFDSVLFVSPMAFFIFNVFSVASFIK